MNGNFGVDELTIFWEKEIVNFNSTPLNYQAPSILIPRDVSSRLF